MDLNGVIELYIAICRTTNTLFSRCSYSPIMSTINNNPVDSHVCKTYDTAYHENRPLGIERLKCSQVGYFGIILQPLR